MFNFRNSHRTVLQGVWAKLTAHEQRTRAPALPSARHLVVLVSLTLVRAGGDGSSAFLDLLKALPTASRKRLPCSFPLFSPSGSKPRQPPCTSLSIHYSRSPAASHVLPPRILAFQLPVLSLKHGDQ